MRNPYLNLKRKRDFENTANISLKNNYYYQAVSKVANSSINAALVMAEMKDVFVNYTVDKKTLRSKVKIPLLSPFQLNDELFKKVFYGDKCFRFTFVRNPYSRLLSCYLDRIQDFNSKPRADLLSAMGRSGRQAGKTISFDQFIRICCSQSSVEQNMHWRRQYDEIMLPHVHYHFIGRFENISQDIEFISRKIFGEVIEPFSRFGKENYSPSITNADEKIARYYTKELVEMIYESYIDDFESFGYVPLQL